MIDVEFELFDKVAKAIHEKFPKAYVVGEYVSAPPKFPCVSIIEVGNELYRKSLNSSGRENHAFLLYEVNVFDNKLTDASGGKKREAKEIAHIVDDTLGKYGFTRIMLQPIPNEVDGSVFRIVGRWNVIVDKDKKFYRR